MKLKNNSKRNISIISGNVKVTDREGNVGFAKGKIVKVIAGSTLEISDELYKTIKPATLSLVENNVLSIVKTAESELTKNEIIDKVMLEADVELKDSSTKAQLQSKAEALGVEV